MATDPLAHARTAPPPIDLRSDTMTRPSAAMRAAMAAADVGDDVWGEDPTVNALQERVAALLGKPAALLVPSGTMSNQIAIRAHTHHGDAMLLGVGSHCTTYESGAAAALSGVQPRELGTGGLFCADDVIAAIPPANVHNAPATLVWLENTHNRGGGRVFPQRDVIAIAEAAHARGLRVHLDGARLLNAAVASGRPAVELAAPVDSTSICLSKGLGAPVGSVLAGSRELIDRALRLRKMFGGGMRQAGILAAAGLYALEHNVARLAEDHANAALLGAGLAALPGLTLAQPAVETNIVVFDLDPDVPCDAPAFLSACAARGVLLCPFGGRRLRAVTHLDVDRANCLEAIRVAGEALRELCG
jgi:threonine aldolase